MKTWSSLALIIAAGAAAAPATAAGKLGDKAPALEIADWIKGGSTTIEDGKIYVIEFWATWCGPCRTTIPHLTKTQQKYKDKNVVVVGVSNEPAARIKPFVDNMGDKMDYIVAADDKNKTFANYLQAYRVNGIPHAFVVDQKGAIVWHGHPMAGMEQKLDELIKAAAAPEEQAAPAAE